jgi:flagellar protein FlgJ
VSDLSPISSASASAAIVGSAGTAAPDTSRLATAENMKAAAEKFESIFIGMMMKSMRSTSLGDELMGSSALDKFRDMQDQQTAQDMSKKMPLGIGAALEKFLTRTQPALTSPQPSSASDGKGSNESGT